MAEQKQQPSSSQDKDIDFGQLVSDGTESISSDDDVLPAGQKPGSASPPVAKKPAQLSPPSFPSASTKTSTRTFKFRKPTTDDVKTFTHYTYSTGHGPTSSRSNNTFTTTTNNNKRTIKSTTTTTSSSSNNRNNNNDNTDSPPDDLLNSAFIEEGDADLNESCTTSLRNLSDIGKIDSKRVYLVTYSQADETRFSRESFGRAVVQCFGGNNVSWFAVAKESHVNGGIHYHMSVRLSKACRWLPVKNLLVKDFGITVNFKENPKGGFYRHAYGYLLKEDTDGEMFHGNVLEKHPTPASLRDLGQQQRGAERANATYRQNRSSVRAASASASASASSSTPTSGKKGKEKKEKANICDISMFIREQNIRNEDELFAAAEERRRADDSELARMILQMGAKRRREIISDAWRMEGAQRTLALRQKTRLNIMQEFVRNNTCTCPTRGLWLTLAIDMCFKNNLCPNTIGGKIYKSLIGGRKKHNNLLIIGASNCAKTFLLEPLNVVFTHVQNTPASSLFGWLGVEQAQVIYLNDFRWVNPITANRGGVILWGPFLRLLEGGVANLPAPMNHHAAHIVLPASNDIPVLCTSIDIIRYYVNKEDELQTPRHARENIMMKERWNAPIELTHVFDEDKKIEIDPCGWCFCRFVLPEYNS